MHYDIRRGPHSVGSHVRDAAAYVCWAFGRAYSHADMKNILEQLAPHLLTVACYDREVLISHYIRYWYSFTHIICRIAFIIFLHLMRSMIKALNDMKSRLIVGEQLQLHFKRMLEDRGVSHMALRLSIQQIIFLFPHEYTLISMLLCLLHSTKNTYIRLWKNYYAAKFVIGYAIFFYIVIICF